ncbi:hypothetical protein P3TCK_07544 [Photobacterium profundum 3TCK]|uniref:Uncharacterized protein n=1 Tax=Photobacterium profundum 3TCK TaxID=314280 RepID=Q1YYG3_9GAMM|nr:hypothetical protein P3TCK_07544 [Photobacterium profundum 3TCK]
MKCGDTFNQYCGLKNIFTSVLNGQVCRRGEFDQQHVMKVDAGRVSYYLLR